MLKQEMSRELHVARRSSNTTCERERERGREGGREGEREGEGGREGRREGERERAHTINRSPTFSTTSTRGR